MTTSANDKRPRIEEAFAVGAVVEDKYHIDKLIGRGGMGMVMRASDVALGRTVAIKAVLPARTDSEAEDFRRQLRDEAAIMARIHSDNVAQVYAFGEHCGFPFFAMEYVTGETLRKFMSRNPDLPLEVVVALASQICSGLDAVHGLAVVHRDVKPENIIIGPHYRVCLVDFGISATAPREDTVQGSLPYLAPEQLAGRPLPAHQQHLSDLYSAALCIFELLTGELPYGVRGTGYGLCEAKIRTAPRPPSTLRADVPPAMDAVLLRALDRDPALRFPSGRELCQALTEALAAVRSPSSGRRILVVDDDPAIRTLYAAVIEARFPDAEIVVAEDGLVAFELAKARHPDLVIVDLNMPRVDGRQLCQALKATPGLTETPLVVISAEPEVEQAETMAALGVSEALRKPVSGRQLATVVERWLEAAARRLNPLLP